MPEEGSTVPGEGSTVPGEGNTVVPAVVNTVSSAGSTVEVRAANTVPAVGSTAVLAESTVSVLENTVVQAESTLLPVAGGESTAGTWNSPAGWENTAVAARKQVGSSCTRVDPRRGRAEAGRTGHIR